MTAALLTLDERKAQATDLTGTAPRSLAADIQEMLDGGLLISISVYGMSIISRALKWEELGFKTDDEKNQRLKAGAKLLVAPDYAKKLASLETRIRQCANRFTRALEAFRPWQWLSFDAYDAFLSRWGDLMTELSTLRAEGIERYDEFCDENATYYGALARRSWRTFQASYEQGAALVLPGGYIFGPNDEDAYVDWVVSNVLEQMPTRDDIAYRIRAEYKTAVLFTQADLAQEAARQAEAYAVEVEADTRIRHAAMQQHLLRIEEQEQERTIRTRNEAIRRAEVERARAQLEQTISPLDEMLQQLMGEITAGAQAVLDSISKNGYVRGKVAERARGLRELFQMMGGRHLQDHGDLERLLDELSARLERHPATDKDQLAYKVDNVIETLGQIVDATRAQVDDILKRTDVQTRAAALEF
ncbi:MAG: hypothetical protein JXA21_10465 [Anaerolineae bacterium]|nr:hypothetical protein [Anaerolineae bacterium]